MICAPRFVFSIALFALTVLAPSRAQQPGSTAPAPSGTVTNSAPVAASPDSLRPDEITGILNDAIHLQTQGETDAALEKINLAIRLAPQDPDSYGLRGGIYAQKGLWPKAEMDYRKVLKIDPTNNPAKFDLAEIQFKQKHYDLARADFLALVKDDDLGDLATYRVFMCDLAAGHMDAAAKELDAFNQVGENASYYFANAAWSLNHHKTDEGRGWLTSASQIYAADKVNSYGISLKDLGYLPLAQETTQAQ